MDSCDEEAHGAHAPTQGAEVIVPRGLSTLRTGLHWRPGIVERLNTQAEFGYVLEVTTGLRYIFVFGFALKRVAGGRLRVGQAVRFRLDERGRVFELTGCV